MTLETDKIICEKCFSRFREADFLTAPDPFVPLNEIRACPMCKSIEQFSKICDEPGCRELASCGTPHPDGYRHTCHKHAP